MSKNTSSLTQTHFPLIIIGAGPAGYTASIYASRYKIQHLLIGDILGGQISKASVIENYPPFKSIKGYELALKFREHAESFLQHSGSSFVFDTVKKVTRSDNRFVVETQLGKHFTSDAIILAIGVKKRQLNVPGEAKLMGKGVSTCVTCDGFFYRGKTVGIVGGGDSAATGALYLAEICPKVYMFVRRDVMRAEPIWQEKIKNNPKITVLYNTEVAEIIGNQKVEGVITKDGKKIELEGLFIEIGHYPDLTIIKDLKVKTDEEGYIAVDPDMSTNVKGFFAAGDITNANNKFKQIAVAVGEGAVAANAAFNYLQRLKS